MAAPYENNRVLLTGSLKGDIEYSHSLYGEAFYTMMLAVPRLSGTEDILPVTFSERLLLDSEAPKWTYIEVNGQLRSYNKQVGDSNRLVITVFARKLASAEGCAPGINEITLEGYICKPPVYRTTPFSREIADILLAVNRSYNKSDYLPIIAWGRNARFASTLPVGEHIRICGRIQSREYQKILQDGSCVSRTAYEVSSSSIERA
ncbi:MAG: Single-stranded DNA-binding protein ssb [Firmicutes bacterium ADurb.Bin182]|nr:MAG: Single-stranded DNA-binding protein ssb [Firmicutes bacterium ADurb.Bin182]